MNYITEPNRIYVTNNKGNVVAEITYPETEKGVYEINRTFVDNSLRGQGIAGKLVELAVNDIIKKNGKITASCSYAKHWLENHGQNIK